MPSNGKPCLDNIQPGFHSKFWKAHLECDSFVKSNRDSTGISWQHIDFTVKVLTQYEPCGGPGGCNFIINNDVWQSQLDQAAGSVWHDPDVGDPYFWIGRP